MIKEDNIKAIQEKLEKERESLLEKIRDNSKVTEFGNDTESSDMTEETEETEDFSNKLAIAQAYRERLEEVENALNKIKLGKYGLCEKCGKEIDEQVLLESPTKKLCKDC